MGLDKWIKPKDGAKKLKGKNESHGQAKKSKSENVLDKDVEKPPIKLTKYTLICPSAKCKYQKTIMKKQLTDIDKICPRCNKEMKVK